MEFSLIYGLEKVGLPIIVTSGRLKNICFLIDTGATINSIFNFVYEHFKDEFKLVGDHSRIMGIEGNYKEYPIVEGTLTFDNTDYTAEFSVVDMSDAVAQVQQETGLQLHGVLGTPFLVENKWILDFEQQKVFQDE